MDSAEISQRFQEFLAKTNYYRKLVESAARGSRSLFIEFHDLDKYDPGLADQLLENPEDVLAEFEAAIATLDLRISKRMFVRVFNLPDTRHIKVKDLRTEHLARLVEVDGLIRQASEVRPEVMEITYECLECGNKMAVLQTSQTLKKPAKCICGKSIFKEGDKTFRDLQSLKIEESPEQLIGGEQPSRIDVILQEDLVEPSLRERLTPGNRVKIVGIMKEKPVTLRTGVRSKIFDVYLQAVYVENTVQEFEKLEVTKEEEKEILEMSKDPKIKEKIISSIAPSIYGNERIKEAIALQMFGGVTKIRSDGLRTRGEIHIFLVGDPGSGKCVSGDTRIFLPTGKIRKMADVAREHAFLGEYVFPNGLGVCSVLPTGKISTRQASKIWKRRAPGRLLRIRTRLGKEFTLTPEHPLFTTNDGLIFARDAGSFRKGMPIAAPRIVRAPLAGYQQLSSPGRTKFSNNSKQYKYPSKLDGDLARLVGYLCGDGYVEKSATSGWISITNNDRRVLADFSRTLRKAFGARTSSARKKGTAAVNCYVMSSALLSFFRDNFPEIARRSRGKSIPEKILSSPDPVLAQFLRGLFECDGHVNLSKGLVEYSTASKELAELVQDALLRFGVVSFLKEKLKRATNGRNPRKQRYFEVVVSGEFTSPYADEIGLVSGRKTDALRRIASKKRVRNTNVDLIYGIGGLLRRARALHGLPQSGMGLPRPTYCHYEQGNRVPSRTAVAKIAKHLLGRFPGSGTARILEACAGSDIFWDTVREIREIPRGREEFVYDFEVEGTHNFIGNGIVLHNSQLLKYVSTLAPKSMYVSGKGATGAGLTAVVVKDEFLGGWALEAGAVVLCNKGLCALDEMDKMQDEDRVAMHEVMEQGCYDNLTEILTDEGWKLFKNLTRREKVASLDRKGNLRFVRPTDYVSADYDGDFYYVRNSKADLAVTPNHNMYASLYKRANEWLPYALYRADQVVLGKRMKIKRTAGWEGKEVAQFSIPPVRKRGNQNDPVGRLTEPIKVPMDAWLEFLGYYLSEGSFGGQKGVPYRTSITQTKSAEAIAKIGRCIRACGFRFSRNGNSFEMNDKQLAAHLSQFGKAKEKFVPAYVKSLSKRQLRIFLDALVLGDGWIRRPKGNRKAEIGFCSSSRRLIDDVQEILLRLGMYGNIYSTDYSGRVSEYKGRKIRGTGRHYSLVFCRTGETQVNAGRENRSFKASYKGRIYCVEVPSHIIYVRRNGKPVWCGNTISIAKATIHANLRAETSILAAANPKLSRFDPHKDIMEQIDMPQTLLSRFDLTFIVRDVPDRDRDEALAEHILMLHKNPQSTQKTSIESRLLRKYISYAKRNFASVRLTTEAVEEIKRFYVGLRSRYASEGEAMQAIPITARQLEAMVRLAEGNARLRFSQTVTADDAKQAIDLMKYCLYQVGFDPETGRIDIARLEGGVTAAKRSKINTVTDSVKELEKEAGGKPFKRRMLMERAVGKGLSEDDAEKIIESLLRDGTLFAPRVDEIQRTP